MPLSKAEARKLSEQEPTSWFKLFNIEDDKEATEKKQQRATFVFSSQLPYGILGLLII